MEASQALARLFVMRHSDEDLRRRGQNLMIVLWGLMGVSVASLPVSIAYGRVGSVLNALVVLPLGLGLLALTAQGRVNLVSIILVCANAASLVLVPVFGSAQFSVIAYYFVINLLVAGVVMRPSQIWATLALSLGALALTTALSWGARQEVTNVLIVAINTGVILIFAAVIAFIGAVTTARALREARQSREEAQRASAALAENLATLESQAARLRETEHMLRSLVGDLETTTVSLADGVLLAPVVGRIDAARAEALLGRLLSAASAGQTRLMVIDIAAVPAVDTQVALALLQTARALRLIGCRVALTGISAEVAATLADFQLRLDEVITARSPQEVLAMSGSAPL